MNKKKRICHIAFEPMNGIPRILRESASAVKAGYEVYIVAQGETHEENGIHFIGFSPSNNRRQRILVTSKNMVKTALLLDADIYQFHDPEFFLYIWKLKKMGKIVIFDSHEFYALQIANKPYLPKLLRPIISKVYWVLEGFWCRRIDATLYVCTIEGKNYFEGRARRATMIANYPDAQVFLREDQNLRPLYERNRQVVYAGGLTETRGITHLAKSVAKAEVPLVLCGEFSSEDYKKKIFSFGEGYIDWRGTLSLSELRKVYEESYVGIATLLDVGQYSKADTLPTKVFEYQALGMPVILSHFPYQEQKIELYRFGICVNPENIDEIANAIKYLLDNPDEAKRMGENGRRAVEEEFNWGVEEKKLLSLYEDILQN